MQGECSVGGAPYCALYGVHDGTGVMRWRALRQERPEEVHSLPVDPVLATGRDVRRRVPGCISGGAAQEPGASEIRRASWAEGGGKRGRAGRCSGRRAPGFSVLATAARHVTRLFSLGLSHINHMGKSHPSFRIYQSIEARWLCFRFGNTHTIL